MKAVIKFFKRTYYKVMRSIAFYPVLISLLYGIAAVISLKVDSSELVAQMKEEASYLFIQDYDTVRAMLSTFIGGIISLTVFSFSMVMVVLGQASSDFSPRLLPGLVSNKRHQIILGIYVGTLLYCTLILLSLGAYGSDSNSVGLSAMLATIMSVLCIVLFIYFINSISSAIQIHNIIDEIYRRCDGYLEDELQDKNVIKIALQYIDSADWTPILAHKTGYFRGFDPMLLSNASKENDNQIEVVPYLNQHVWKGDVALRIQHDITDEQLKNLIFCMDISSDRHEDDKGIGGMIKLMEIAVKAMSPGINDPGTAIGAVTKLGSLLAIFLRLPHMVSTVFNEGRVIVIRKNIPAEELMRILVQPIRLYAKQDSTVMYELIKALQFTHRSTGLSKDNRQAVAKELEAARYDLEKNIENDIDKARIFALYKD